MARFAIVENGKVINVVEAVEQGDVVPPEGLPAGWSVYPAPEAGPGDSFDGTQFTRPPSPPRPPSPIVDGLVFLERLTDQEYQAVMDAARTDVQISRWLDALHLQRSVDVSDNRTIGIRQVLITRGILNAARADLVFRVA